MAAGQAPRGSAYFEKKGEVHELRQLLRGAAADRDQQKKRDAIKKVIAYMTLGIDVSPLFSEMVMASATTDLVQKKMVYLYLVNYAESNSELAILAINTLQKDSRDDDPMIRGLALRSLCSLNISNTVEYLQPAVQRCLEDVNGYVRKTAVVGAVKLFHISRHAVLETKIIEIMKRMIKDSDPHVVANTIYAIEEVLVDEGGLEPNKEMVTTLLNKLNQFSEWGQCAVLRLLTKYQVEDETEMFDIMNVLDGLLKQSSSAVVLNVTKIFLDLTCNRPDLMIEVLRRLKGPLLTLMSVATPELAYTVLVHIQALCTRGGLTLDCFSPEFKQFFCRYNDPSYIKNVKIDVLTMLANNTNFEPVVAELSEYVTDVDATISRQAVRAIGKLAVRVAAASEMVVSTLTGLLELDIDYVSTEAAVVMKDLVRKYPQQFQRASTAVERCLKIVTEPEGKCAILWILGEYGLLIQDAPYLLEPMIDGFLEEPSGAVKLEMLSAAVKLFFCRAPEMQKMLSRLLHKGIQETNHPDVRDRALLYYRLLEISPEEARRVICAPKEVVEEFMEELDLEAKERIFEEFNTLSVVYKQPASKFVVGKVPSSFLGASRMPPPPVSGNYSDPVIASIVADVNGHFDTPPVEVPAPRAPRVESSDLLGGGMMDIGEPLQNGYEPVKSISGNIPTSTTSPSPVGDLLGMDDLLGGGDDMLGGGSSPAGSTSFSLSSSALMDSQTFQTRWAVLTQFPTQQRQMRPGMVTTEAIQDALRRYNVLVIASGAVGTSMKFYFFAKQESGPPPALQGSDIWFLVELLVVPGGHAQCSLKADNAQPASVEGFYGVLWEALSAFVQ